MISIVVSTKKIDNNFKEMLLKSVGLKDVQLLIYENDGLYSLTEIYNKGLLESKYDVVVFCHDDIKLKTKNWGNILLKNYSTDEFGILGVAGSRKLENGVWWHDNSTTYGQVYHTDGKKEWLSQYSRILKDDIQEVVVVDGVFFSVKKSLLKANFDEKYNGFHFYDISFCFDNFKKGVKVGVHTNILLTHNSVGHTNTAWEENRMLFVEDNKDFLPSEVDLDVPYIDINVQLKTENKLGIIIPTKNNVDELLIPCLESIIKTTKYSNYKIYIADTGSNEIELKKTKEYINSINKNKEVLKLIEYDYYNFAKINNNVVKKHVEDDTELLLFVNNDIEMVNDAISVMVDIYQKNKKDVGTIGCRLHFENGSLQHLGISLEHNQRGEVGITHKFLKMDYRNTPQDQKTIQTHGNTAAFMMVSKKLFDKIGGFNEHYKECFEDVEFNLECYLNGKKNLTNSNAVCYHFESQTRGRSVDSGDVNLILSFIDRSEKIKRTLYKINN